MKEMQPETIESAMSYAQSQEQEMVFFSILNSLTDIIESQDE